MTRDLYLAVFIVMFGATGTYLMLPHSHGERKPRNVHALGAVLGVFALLLYGLYWTAPGPFVSAIFFYLFGFSSLAAAVLTVTNRDPTHSALWFAAVVLSTAGLYLLAGAQFLAVGTVIVYAGAIIVTFLFVIMLAQMEGRAPYDRAARMPFRATWTCFVLFLGVLWSIFHMAPPASAGIGTSARSMILVPTKDLVGSAKATDKVAVANVVKRAVRSTAMLKDATVREKPHVAGLGETLYTDHLVTVEIAGALLFVALIGALSIAAPKPPVRPGQVSSAPV